MLEHLDFAEYGQPGANELVAELRAELHRVLLALLQQLQRKMNWRAPARPARRGR
jgi:hypothetical protein